ncbi:MAG: trypsin-like peptidase domain-containing protein [Candidatus Sungiibacteriota bacterium]|uniref:Trypsin-like peptidase domain-containing protein n=1 Tax=Candidatus Sungiibacteriota bacterium TaxID=2750080 RepID=A0A7T5RJS5_9BACT|nr:MAG: trypsin-like peptidase domain-containing protein [Candidatus Sungbacteria bacterium]
MTKYMVLVLVLAASLGFLFFQDIGERKTTITLPPSEQTQLSLTATTTDEKQNTVPPPLSKVPVKPLPREPVLAPPDFLPKLPPPPAVSSATTVPEGLALAPEEVLPPVPEFSSSDEAEILRSVVKIECPSSDGLGKYVGSGFMLKGGIVVTAAHVVKDSASENCSVIFPRERKPIHYLHATIENLQEVIRRHDEEGIDVAILRMPQLESFPEARAIFQEYPQVPYPLCTNPKMLGDKLLHFGYPSNYVDQNYLSKLEGEAVVHADIKGMKTQLSQDQTYTYRSPIFQYTNSETEVHPYMVSRVASFYGDSGGLAFNATKKCIVGPHRGGTIGRSSGENFSIFMNLGWNRAKEVVK